MRAHAGMAGRRPSTVTAQRFFGATLPVYRLELRDCDLQFTGEFTRENVHGSAGF
jgi:hypothetical protein